MSFATIVGQDRVKRLLQNGLKHETLSHAYIFSGPSGSGRRQMALTLAQAVYCLEMKDDACGTCLNCRKVAHQNHPDLHWIEPDGASLKIEQIRELQKQFAYRSTTSQTKVYVLQNADRMTTQAANSLLKFLEEPTSDVLAILIAENGHALLPTIQSRAQWVPFTPLGVQELSQKLIAEGLSATLVLPAVHIVAGLDAARELIQGNWFAEARNVMIQLVMEALTSYPAALLSIQQKVIKAEWVEHLPIFLDLSILWFKDMVHFICGREDSMIYLDRIDWIRQHAFSREIQYWVACMEHTIELQKRLRFNANAQLAMEKWIIDIQRGD
ncbi:DNA polymerase III subunit delta' [Paenibacillus psychroresistens]|uniref:DNA polymerase III subunit delta n=1 Tax=Paenibacillus psychroresistens TaxID=1778678 RepID=A0A6B8RDP0_9BACL|nr:DNA polymerase III subunit delta' [Paenibacillus psychroresistens]QGQ93663.1 DNA polymerase III subunit delta' [Paenibacillus psychroresistens]